MWVKIVFNKFGKQPTKKIFLLCQDCEGIPYTNWPWSKRNSRPPCTEKLFGSQNFKCWGLMPSKDRGEPLSAPWWRRFNLIKTQRVAIYCLLRPPWPLTCVPENSFNCHPSSSGAVVVYNPGTSGIVKSDKVQASKKLEKAKFSESRRSLERSLIAPQFPLIGGPCILVSIASHYIQ